MSDEMEIIPGPFDSKGPLPEWRMIYDELLVNADFGTVVTYDQLDAALGRTFIENRSPLYRARQHLGEMRRRWMEAVPKVGYRVIQANEHMKSAQARKNRAKTQLRRMVDIATYTDLSRLQPNELQEFDAQSRINMALASVAIHHERRLNRIEQILRDDGKL